LTFEFTILNFDLFCLVPSPSCSENKKQDEIARMMMIAALRILEMLFLSVQFSNTENLLLPNFIIPPMQFNIIIEKLRNLLS